VSTAKRLIFIALAVAVLLSISGCSVSSVDGLYSLPQQPDDYLQLQQLIEDEIASGSEYSAPTAGNYMQSVQSYDFDGDGTDEAVAFFRSADQTPKICIYTQGDAQYNLACTITGKGTSIRCVDYADLDNDGFAELIVTWQESTDLRLLNVYSLRDYQATEFLSVNCSNFIITDLDDTGVSELVTLTADTPKGNSVSVYYFDDQGNSSKSETQLSDCMETFDRARTGRLANGSLALFIEGSCDNGNGIVTDILLNVRGTLKNITITGNNSSSNTQREMLIYSADIDRDGYLEVPISASTLDLLDKPAQSDLVELLNWYVYANDGSREFDFSTLYCNTGGWYFILPENLRQGLAIRYGGRTSGGETAMTLTHTDPETEQTQDILTLYTLTGINRKDYAKQDNRFTLAEDGTTIYAAELHCASAILSRQTVLENFNMIYTEWNNGSLS
jgi:hypothetical protein